MRTQHTPGPWSLDLVPLVETLYNHVAIDSEYHGALAQVVWKMDDDTQSPECEANAHLIAAAPELLEALLEYKRFYEEAQPAGGWQGVYELGNAAIAKARGESE